MTSNTTIQTTSTWLTAPPNKLIKVVFWVFFVFGSYWETLRILLHNPMAPKPHRDVEFMSGYTKAAISYLAAIANHPPDNLYRFVTWPFEMGIAITYLTLSILIWPLWISLKGLLFSAVGILWAAIFWQVWTLSQSLWEMAC